MKKLIALLLVTASLFTGTMGLSASAGNEDFDDFQDALPVSV